MNIDPQLLQLLQQQPQQQSQGFDQNALIRAMSPGPMKAPKLADDWWSQLHNLPEFRDILKDPYLNEAKPGYQQFNGTIDPEIEGVTPQGRVIDPNEFKLPMGDKQTLGIDASRPPDLSQMPPENNKDQLEMFLQQMRRYFEWSKGQNL